MLNNKVKLQTDNYRFIFEQPEEYWLYMLKDGEEYDFLYIKVLDRKTNKEVALYFKEYKSIVKEYVLNEFINKFMSDSSIRKQYLISGKNVMETLENNDIVNKRCREAINAIVKKKINKLKFKGFANLKTYGRDKVSAMKISNLETKITASNLNIINDTFAEPKSRECALRWMIRGLPVEYAIRKVKTDLEIANNIKK